MFFKPTVLLIEDDADLREAMKDVLEGEGFNTETAENGQEGLKYLSESTDLPSLVLVDLMMPVMGGVEFCERTQKIDRYKSLSIVILSADGQPEKRKQQCGVKEYIRKPVELAAFVAKMRELTH